MHLLYLKTTVEKSITNFGAALAEQPVCSPDGKYIAFSVAGEVGSNIWVYESLIKEVKQITQEEQGHRSVWPVAS